MKAQMHRCMLKKIRKSRQSTLIHTQLYGYWFKIAKRHWHTYAHCTTFIEDIVQHLLFLVIKEF